MDEVGKVVDQLLPLSAKCVLAAILERLEEKGVEELDDLRYINFEEDLKGILKEVPARKFKNSIDTFFNGESSMSRVDAPQSSKTQNQPHKEPAIALSSSLDWAEDFQIPVEKLSKTIRNKLEKNRRITPTELRELVRILIAGVLDLNQKPLKRHLSVIAKKVIHVFPIMRETVGNCVIGTGYDGLLRKCIARVENVSRVTAETREKKLAEKKTSKRSYGCQNFYPLQSDLEGLEGKQVDLQNQYVLLSWDVAVVDRLMEETFPCQRKSIVEYTSIEKLKVEWPFLFVSRYALKHFKKLMGIDVNVEMENAVQKKVPELYDFFKSQESRQIEDQERYLEALACHFSENSTSIIRIFEDISVKELVKNESTPLSPYIAMFGNPYGTDDNCVLFVERQEASEFMTLKQASCLWIASFYIFGLEYPEECPATAEFIQRAFLGINPEKGTKGRKRARRTNVNYKVSKLVEKLCNYKSIWNA